MPCCTGTVIMFSHCALSCVCVCANIWNWLSFLVCIIRICADIRISIYIYARIFRQSMLLLPYTIQLFSSVSVLMHNSHGIQNSRNSFILMELEYLKMFIYSVIMKQFPCINHNPLSYKSFPLFYTSETNQQITSLFILSLLTHLVSSWNIIAWTQLKTTPKYLRSS